MSDPINIFLPGILNSSAREMPLSNLKVETSVTVEGMLPVKLGKMKHVTSEY